jgi:hypothetical protein
VNAIETRSFHIGDILTITTGLLVSPRHMGGVYDLLNWMTGDDLFTHQLPRACDECAPTLRVQHPDLAAIETPTFPQGGAETAVNAWLGEQVARFGEYREVTPLATGEHTRIDPLAELAMNHPDVQVIPVVLPDGDL